MTSMKQPLLVESSSRVPSPAYRDDPHIETASLASSAVSLHSVSHESDIDQDIDDDLPAYSDTAPSTILTPATTIYTPSTTAAPLNPQYMHQNLLASRYTWFSQAGRAKSSVVPLGTSDPVFSHDPEQLRLLILNQSGIPPRPYVVFRGSHTEETTRDDGKKQSKHTTEVDDFHITVSCEELFAQRACPTSLTDTWHELHTVPDHVKAHRGGLYRSRARYPMEDAEGLPETPAFNEQTLKIWSHMFCSRASHGWFPYTFTLRRRITDWDTTQIETRLTGMIRQTNYHGRVSVHFPIEHETFSVYSSHWMNYARTNKYIWWTCVVLQLWIITWPVLWFCTGRFEVVHANWPCKKWIDGAPVFASYSEDDWLGSWGQAIIEAAFGRRKQVLSRDDVQRVMQLQQASRVNMQWLASQQAPQPQPMGNPVVDSVMGAVNGIQNARVQRDLVQGWGADAAGSGSSRWWTDAKDRFNVNIRINNS